MAKYDDLDTRQIFTIGIGSVVVTVVTILAVQYIYFLLVDAHQSNMQAESSYSRQNDFLADQVGQISKYGADPDTGNVTIPIEKAMEEIVKESHSKAHNEADHAENNDQA